MKEYVSGLQLDREIVHRCIQSDRRSQKQLFDQYKDAMYTISYRILKDKEVAADSLQEAFLQVFRSLSSFEFRSTLGAWIKTIVIRTAIKKLKEEAVFERLEDISFEKLTARPNELTAYDLENAILCLPGGYRTVFILIEIEGYKHKEVAEMMGISEGTSKSQLHDAKKLLQVKLKAFR